MRIKCDICERVKLAKIVKIYVYKAHLLVSFINWNMLVCDVQNFDKLVEVECF